MQMKLLDLWDDADQHPISRLGFASRYHDVSTFAVPVSGGYVKAYVAKPTSRRLTTPHGGCLSTCR